MAEPAPRLNGIPMLLAVLGAAVMGALLGIVSAFLVPTGPRLGLHNGILPASSARTGLEAAAAPVPHAVLSASVARAALTGPVAPVAASNGTLLSVGVALAFIGCLGLGLLMRQCTGERLVALAPVSAWLIIALLALSEVHGDLVLPTAEPGVVFLYAGVVGGAISLLPAGLFRSLRARA